MRSGCLAWRYSINASVGLDSPHNSISFIFSPESWNCLPRSIQHELTRDLSSSFVVIFSIKSLLALEATKSLNFVCEALVASVASVASNEMAMSRQSLKKIKSHYCSVITHKSKNTIKGKMGLSLQFHTFPSTFLSHLDFAEPVAY